jgi:hypothetical protein
MRVDSRAPKPLNQARATNGNACLRVHVNTIFNNRGEG